MTMTEAAILGLGAALGLMVAVWLASLVLRDASLVDRFWGAGFVVVAWARLSCGGASTSSPPPPVGGGRR